MWIQGSHFFSGFQRFNFSPFWTQKLVFFFCLAAVQQDFNTEAGNEYVILGNDVIMKCSIPSFVADFVSVTGWVDSEGNEFQQTSDAHGNFLGCCIRVREPCRLRVTLQIKKWLIISGTIFKQEEFANRLILFLVHFFIYCFSCSPDLQHGGHEWGCDSWQWCHCQVPDPQLCVWLCPSHQLGWLRMKWIPSESKCQW